MVNEGNLTGESLQVQKFTLAHDHKLFNFMENRANILFDGSIVTLTRKTDSNKTLALVGRTGFYSIKG